MSNITRHYLIPASHPCFAGHFPGNPIVPGVIILDYVRDLLAQWHPTDRIKTIPYVKFLHPLRPEQTVTITLTQSTSTIKFECTCDGLTVASGALLTEPKP